MQLNDILKIVARDTGKTFAEVVEDTRVSAASYYSVATGAILSLEDVINAAAIKFSSTTDAIEQQIIGFVYGWIVDQTVPAKHAITITVFDPEGASVSDGSTVTRNDFTSAETLFTLNANTDVTYTLSMADGPIISPSGAVTYADWTSNLIKVTPTLFSCIYVGSTPDPTLHYTLKLTITAVPTDTSVFETTNFELNMDLFG